MRPLPRRSPFDTEGTPLGKSPEPRAEDRVLEDKAFADYHAGAVPPLGEGAWKAAEDRIRRAKGREATVIERREAEEARERRIREVVERDRIDAPAKGSRVRAYAPEGQGGQEGAVAYPIAFRPSTDTWVAEVLIQGASRSRVMVLRRVLGGWEEVLA